ncbi:putative COP9 signalosome subunit 6 [Talaromyces proteolyticus]|uniref:COP9 signalosome complex subunit 6 n=1 Tax=Talaromyces proteolyticus TaxID=1131652 RepID=A0AAD4Q4B2_9EURO|nr:putative COP9 signalosome subunit 6 [Talaromyces proteolyticus]KAH8702487.1 putative COP9 signalosome subunit 6 [Talaromyces proteolyticus]
MADSQANPLISTKPSDSGLHVVLHPLIPLTISDYATRHAARQQRGPIVGALLGQQQGRQVSLEYAFECHTTKGHNDETLLHSAWFADRLQQFKDVHKSPALDLLGWFTITPPTGPSPSQLGIHRQLLREYNESAVLLAFHPSQINQTSGNGAKLPLTIYESIFEGENIVDADRAMQLDGEDHGVHIRFRELPYSIETGDAEMISVDFVARGGGNAMAIKAHEESAKAASEEALTKINTKKTGIEIGGELEDDDSTALSLEDEDLIANFTTRLNAVKTLGSRIHLIKSFLENHRSSSLEDNINLENNRQTSESLTYSYPILRNISSLISDLSLLTPQDAKSFAVESLAQENDVALVTLLGELGNNVKHIRELGKKLSIVENAKQNVATGGRKAHLALHSRLDEERDSMFGNIGSSGLV